MPKTEPLTTAQVARLLRRDVRTVHRMHASGRLPALMRVPGYKGPLLFDPDEVERVREELVDEPASARAAAGAA